MIQKDEGSSKLAGREVEIKGLTSKQGALLNGKKGCYLTGTRTGGWTNKPMIRYGVWIPNDEDDGGGEIKSLPGGNLKLLGTKTKKKNDTSTQQLLLSPANNRASCINTPLGFSELSGKRDIDMILENMSKKSTKKSNKEEMEKVKTSILDFIGFSTAKSYQELQAQSFRNFFCIDPDNINTSGSDNHINDDKYELGVRCRGDVIVIRLLHNSGMKGGGLLKEMKIQDEHGEEPESEQIDDDEGGNIIGKKKNCKRLTYFGPNTTSNCKLIDFTHDLYKKTWGIFTMMGSPFPGLRVQMGTIMPDNPQAQEHLAGILSSSTTVTNSTNTSTTTNNNYSPPSRRTRSTLNALEKAKSEVEKLKRKQELSETLLEDPDPEPENIIGKTISIIGLKNQQHYNGKKGKVLKQIIQEGGHGGGEEVQKYEIQLLSDDDNSNKILRLKKDNLQINER